MLVFRSVYRVFGEIVIYPVYPTQLSVNLTKLLWMKCLIGKPQESTPIMVSNWLGKCAKALEAKKSAAASRILGVDKKGPFALSRDNQLRSLAVVAFLAVAEHNWMDALNPIDLLMCGVLEPEEVFVKPEMHAAKKVKTKRWRAIWHCSAQAELTTRLLHDCQNKAEITAYQCGMTHSEDWPTFGSCPAYPKLPQICR